MISFDILHYHYFLLMIINYLCGKIYHSRIPFLFFFKSIILFKFSIQCDNNTVRS